MNNVTEAIIIKGKYKGEDILIPRVPMIPTNLSFNFKRIQFPVCLAFAMIINNNNNNNNNNINNNKFSESNRNFHVPFMLSIRALENRHLSIFTHHTKRQKYWLSESFKLINCIVSVL